MASGSSCEHVAYYLSRPADSGGGKWKNVAAGGKTQSVSLLTPTWGVNPHTARLPINDIIFNTRHASVRTTACVGGMCAMRAQICALGHDGDGRHCETRKAVATAGRDQFHVSTLLNAEC